MYLAKYKKNLKVEGDKVISYTTHVATIKDGKLYVLGYWSQTTSKHINYVACQYGLDKVEGKPEDAEQDGGLLKSVALVAKIGDVLCDGQKEKNDWKKRMLNTLPGSDFPEDWDTLTEDEKTKRLDGAVNCLV